MTEEMFTRNYLGRLSTPDSDPEYKLFLEAWLIYYRTAEAIDGHIKFPKNSDEYELCKIASKAARNEQTDFLRSVGYSYIPTDKEIREKWQQAKRDACDRLGIK